MKRLIIFPRAKRDAQQIFDWLAQRSPQGANHWFSAFQEAAIRLLDDSKICSLAPEDEVVHCSLRQFLFKTRHGKFYRGLFIVEGIEVRILRIRGPGEPPLAPDEIVS